MGALGDPELAAEEDKVVAGGFLIPAWESLDATACFRGPINFGICSRVSGPRRYDNVQRVWKDYGLIFVHIVS